jgi:hypothetical protein
LPGLSDAELDARFGEHRHVHDRWQAGLTDRYNRHVVLLDTVLGGDRRTIEREAVRHVLEGWRWLLDEDDLEGFAVSD